MKFLQFMKDGQPALGLFTISGIVDVGANPGMPRTMKELCERGIPAGMETLYEPLIPMEEITFAPAVTGMEKILCIGLNYKAHALETGLALPEFPAVFCKFANALAAHEQTIPLPQAEEIDYEAELVLIMGQDGKIFAATCGNDLSIREWQRASTQWLCGKTYDGFGPIGPYVVEWEDLPQNAAISCYVNGERRQSSHIDDLIFSPQEIVDYLMPRIPLKAGDIIFTGTPSGVMMGYPADEKNWLKKGDTVEITIGGIGTLRNTMA